VTRGSRRAEEPLPVRSIADIRLSEAVMGDECPVCVVRRSAAASYLQSLLGEGVTDPQTRGELRQARGFCRAHTHALLETDRAESGGALGAAILLEAALGWRLDEVEAVRDARRKATRRRAAASPPACPVCAHVEQAAVRAGRDIVGWLSDEAWHAELAGAALCIDDLLLVCEAGAGSDELETLLEGQIQAMSQIRQLVDSYIHHSSQDRRQLQTDEERQAVERAARLLGGDDRRG
jgi:hypothetical protein